MYVCVRCVLSNHVGWKIYEGSSFNQLSFSNQLRIVSQSCRPVSDAGAALPLVGSRVLDVLRGAASADWPRQCLATALPSLWPALHKAAPRDWLRRRSC